MSTGTRPHDTSCFCSTQRYQTLLQLLIEQGSTGNDWSFLVLDEGRHWPSVNVAGHAVFEPVPGGADVDAQHRFRESMFLVPRHTPPTWAC